MCFCGCIRYRPPTINKPAPIQVNDVPLKEFSIEVNIVDFIAQISYKQKFVNEGKDPLEYEFVLESQATVCDFIAEVDGKKIRGICKEKEKAKDTYDDAIASGNGAYLLEQNKEQPDVFTASIGNLPPGKEATITLIYVKELEFEEGQLKFEIPSTMPPPNYNIPTPKLTISLNTTSMIKSISSPSHPISFEFGEEPTYASIKFADGEQNLKKNFSLFVKLFKPNEPLFRIQEDDKGKKVAMIAMYPKLELAEDEALFNEIIFVIDRSGSMAGARINQVKNCMQILLKSLPEGTLFNIIGFGTKHNKLFSSGSVEYNEKNLETATKFVNTLTANMGGTNIKEPLLGIFKEQPKDGIPRQIFLLTDGEVDNTQECIDTVRKNAQTTRVFTFGISGEASKELVQGIAKAGEGNWEMIVDTATMEQKVLRQLNRAMQPALTDLKVEWGNLNIKETAPFRLPPLFAGGRLVVYGYLNENSQDGDVTISAKTAIKPWNAIIKVQLKNVSKGTAVPKLAAKTLIRDLEESRSFLHDNNGDLLHGKSKEDVIKEIVRLSTSQSVLSKHTAFVAVEKRDEATEGTMQIINIPMGISKFSPNKIPQSTPNRPSLFSTSISNSPPQSPLKYVAPQRRANASYDASMNAERYEVGGRSSRGRGGGGGSRDGKEGGSKGRSSSASKKDLDSTSDKRYFDSRSDDRDDSDSRSYGSERSYESKKLSKSKDEEKEERSEGSWRQKSASTLATTSSISNANYITEEAKLSDEVQDKPVPEIVRNIIIQQKFNGNWTLDSLLALVSTLKVDAVKKALPSSVNSSPEIDSYFATVIVIQYFATAFIAFKDSWDMVVKKAKKWLSKEAKNLKLEGVDFETPANKLIKDVKLI